MWECWNVEIIVRERRGDDQDDGDDRGTLGVVVQSRLGLLQIIPKFTVPRLPGRLDWPYHPSRPSHPSHPSHLGL